MIIECRLALRITSTGDGGDNQIACGFAATQTLPRFCAAQ
jgi:hypothetical protein